MTDKNTTKPTTEEILEKTVKNLDLFAEKMKEFTGKTESQLKKLNRQIEVIQERLNNITPHVVEEYLTKAKKDATEVHRGYKLLILKNCVATEVVFMARQEYPEFTALLSRTVVRAFDELDEWWLSKEDLPLQGWVKTLTSLALKYDQRDKETGERRKK